ncbi:MAG TPA: FAD-dependent oxidoreductase [Pyrinomonadaceae bacterium]|nr:FAD-dependent oxidoreductase [Pyrinomonadaceae bacterium]
MAQNSAKSARPKRSFEQSRSVWMETADLPLETPLTERITADVCIVGAGIAGMTTAYLLAREGKSVVVLDDGPIGGGMTQRTTAHLVNALDDRYFELERLHGEEGSRLAAESHTAAIDKIESIVSEENIDCEFERLDGYLFVPPRESKQILDDELAAVHRAGLTDIEMVERVPWDSYDTGPALRFPRQAQFHPLKYLAGLAEAIQNKRGRIYTQTHANEVEGGKQARVETNGGGVVTAGALVVATNTPVNDRIAIHTKQAAYLTYVIGARVPKGSVTRGLYWDTPDPYHYVRLETVGNGSNAYDVLIVGGEDHKTGQQDDGNKRFGALERWTRHRFPMVESIDYRWSGEVMEPIDGLAFIGRNPLDEKNVFIATGDSGNGMTHGTIAGILLTDLIMGRKNSWESIYDPSRITLKALPEFAKENFNVAVQYTDLVVAGDVDSVDEIKRGAGAIISRGLHKVAAYRDPEGGLHERSAVCPHLGCIVNWNTLENTWDCPCHGSRYDAHGKVFQGPANRDLGEAEAENAQSENSKQQTAGNS